MHDQQTVMVPVYYLDRASFNQGKNAAYEFVIRDDDVSNTLVAKGPGGIMDEKMKHG